MKCSNVKSKEANFRLLAKMLQHKTLIIIIIIPKIIEIGICLLVLIQRSQIWGFQVVIIIFQIKVQLVRFGWIGWMMVMSCKIKSENQVMHKIIQSKCDIQQFFIKNLPDLWTFIIRFITFILKFLLNLFPEFPNIQFVHLSPSPHCGSLLNTGFVYRFGSLTNFLQNGIIVSIENSNNKKIILFIYKF